jgi:hypothetical protein
MENPSEEFRPSVGERMGPTCGLVEQLAWLRPRARQNTDKKTSGSHSEHEAACPVDLRY